MSHRTVELSQHSVVNIALNFIPQPKTRLGVQRQRDGTFHVFVNGEDQGVAAMDIPQVSRGLFGHHV